MSLKNLLEKDLRDAMRARDDVCKRTLRMALSAIKLAEVDNRGALVDSDILAILQKEVKSRREAIAEVIDTDHQEFIDSNKAEISILKRYLPQALTEEELNALAQKAIEEVGAVSQRDLGKVMKVLMPRVRGQADGGVVNRLVRQLLVED